MTTETVTFHDDQFDFDPNAYLASSTGRAASEDALMPQPGFYTIRVVAGGLKKHKETGELVLDKDGRKIFEVQRIAIVEPEDAAGSLKLFQTIYTNGFHPRNWKTGEVYTNRPKEYEFMKLLMAIDVDAVVREGSPNEKYEMNVQNLDRLLQIKPTLTVRLTFEGTDKAHAEALIAQGLSKKDAYKQSRLNGKAFRNTDGSYRLVTEGPSGQMIEARLKIAEYVPATQVASVTLGPLTARVA